MSTMSTSNVPGTIILDPQDEVMYAAWERADAVCPVKFYHAVAGLVSPIPGETHIIPQGGTYMMLIDADKRESKIYMTKWPDNIAGSIPPPLEEASNAFQALSQALYFSAR